MLCDVDDAASFEGCENIEPDEIATFLKRDRQDIDVEEDESFRLSPDNKRCNGVFATVRPRKFEHLQALGFVPAGLAETKVREAMRADDDAVLTMAMRTPHSGSAGCDCDSHSAGVTTPMQGSPIRQAYDRIRKTYNPALGTVLSSHNNARVAWDSPVAIATRKWVDVLVHSPVIVIAAVLDITIARNATMTVETSVKSLLAYNIWIHSTGSFVHRGGYLKIWANRLDRYRILQHDAIKVEARKIPPVWLN